VIRHPRYPVEPWAVREEGLDLTVLAQAESVFALSNGHIGLRGNLDEGEPNGLPGTYVGGFYETRPLPYAEAGYGYPESGQSIVNVTNGKLIRLLVDDEPFDLRYGHVVAHERVLDLRAGTLTRCTDWTSPAGRTVRVTSVRIVSIKQRAVAAIRWSVQPLDGPARVIVQSELVSNEAMPALSEDPRVAAVLGHPLEGEEHHCNGPSALLVHRTRHSHLRLAAAMDHIVDCDVEVAISGESRKDWARTTFVCPLAQGETLRIDKLLSYGWSAERTLPALRGQVEAALSGALTCGWEAIAEEQRVALEEFWDAADVEVVGDPEVQQAVRYALFQVLQAGARAEQRAVPAKGLTGDGYDGHTFWDAEMFLLPVLTYTRPDAAADFLRWRHSILPLARERALTLGYAGAAFPWRTIHGEECSGYWPAGTAAMHISADVAVATQRYLDVHPDEEFDREVAVEILVEVARLWLSFGHHDADAAFRIDGVTGPDEYSAIADNNTYTNLMVRRALRAAVAAVERQPDIAAHHGVDAGEVAAWTAAADAVVVPYDAGIGVHEQSEHFTRHARWDFEATPPEHYPLLLHATYLDLYRKQVVKQADLLLALHWAGDEFSAEDKARDLDYYEALTVRDSSLSACTQAVVCAEVGHLDLAYDYLRETALIDLRDLQDNTRDGLHLASLAGTWLAVVAGFGGMRDHGGQLSFAPQLPVGWERFCFALRWRGMRVAVSVEPEATTYSVRDGADAHASVVIRHHGEEMTVVEGQPQTVANRVITPLLPRPVQPPGREPRGRR
jgi:alpha,alpha-trehalose phosphorylase